MTRYELSDGKSHKFWAASVDGEELTTNWGRIGTDGQSKTKTLASPEAADKELAKLIRAKTKKGYVLVSESAAPAKPAAAKPTATKPATKPAEPDPEPAEPILSDLPDESVANTAGLEKHMPVTRGAVKPIKFVSLETAWRRFCGRAQKLKNPTRDVQDRVFDGLGSALNGLLDGELIPFPSAPDDAGLLMARLAAVTTYGHNTDALLDVALASEGAVYALETVLAAMSWKGIRSVSKLERGDRGFDRFIAPQVIRLRSIACGATDEDYEAMLESAKRFEPRFFGQRAARAVVFPSEPGFLAEVISQMKTVAAGLPTPQNDQERGEQARLQEAVESAGRVLLWDVSQAEEVQLITQFTRCTPDDMLAPISRLGAKMTSMVMQCATDFEARSWVDKEAEQELAKLLIATPSDEPILWLIAHMDRPSFSQALSRAAKAYPVRVLTLLGPVATGRGKAAGIALSLVSQVLGLYPAALEVAKATWDEGTQTKINKLMEDNTTAPPADVSSLPKIFTEPRWTQKRAKSVKNKAIELAVLEHPRVFQWPEGVRERWLKNQGHEDDWQSMYAMATSSEEKARRLLQEWKPENYWPDGWEQRVIARLGQDTHRIVRSLMPMEQALAVRCALPFGDVAFAGPVADAYTRLKSARKEARAWLLHHPEVALVGLIPAVMGKGKKAAESARRAITLLVGAGHGDLLLEVAGRYGDEALARAEELSKLDALDDLPKKLPVLPTWCAGVTAPELKTGGSLPKEALNVLLTMLAISKPGDPYAGVEIAVDSLTGESLARTSWSLFEAWRLGGMDSKQGWAFHQLGLLGDDECARKLTPILRKWPGEGGHARATQGLEILAEIGSDVALMNLYAMSQKLKFKGLKKKAAEKVQEIADARGMSKLELADRLVPDFDLDRTGSMTLDFGPRRFEVAFDEQLKPVIRDESGKIRKSLPKVGAKDDADKAADATTRFKRLKKDVKAVAQMQIARLENVMCEGRTWTQDDFQSFLVDHPLLIHVVRRLVWGVIDGDEVKATFRVAEDNTFADADDETITLPEGRVGLVHLLQLSEIVAGKWGDFLSDYEVLQPFDQIARTTYALTPAEIKSKSIDRVDGRVVPTSDVMKLTKLGWQRGDPQDGGCICWMQRETSAGYFILPLDPGMIVGMPMEFPEQTLGTIQLEKSAWGNGSLPLTNASATQLSEAIRSLDPVVE
ncbi:MAG: DUF4132 domain-containing protein, partial [Polyangiales bacterium]